MAIREGRWDCQYCGATGIGGRHQACGSCGRSRPAGTKFYLPSDADIVAEEKLLAQARIGPDWVCAFCDSSNPANLDTCYSCRAPRDSDAHQQAVVNYGLEAVPTAGDNAPPEPAAPAPVAAPAAAPAAGRRAALPALAIGGGLVALCACFLLAFYFFSRTETVSAEVEALRWERSVEVEIYTTVVEEDWSLPAGARQLGAVEDIREYQQIIVGYETVSEEIPEQVQVGTNSYVCGQRDLGNGFFEDVMCSEPIYETRYRTETREEPIYEQQPVYATRYTYEIERWAVDRTERAGGSDRSPYWPSVGDGERAGARQETYEVTFVAADGARYTMAFDEARWRTFQIGDSHTLEVDGGGDPIAVDP